jgi:hypothetical protein
MPYAAALEEALSEEEVVALVWLPTVAYRPKEQTHPH